MICDGFNCLLLSVLILLPFIISVVVSVLLLAIGLTLRRKRERTTMSAYLAIACFILAGVSLAFVPTKYALSKVSYQNESRKESSLLDFTGYEPAYMPNKLTSRIIEDPKDKGSYFMVSDYEGITIKEFNLSGIRQAYGVQLKQNECGPYDPEFGYVIRNCSLLGKTRSGVSVYYDSYPPRKTPLSSMDYAFATAGNTGITVEGAFSSWQEIIKIYGSLKPVNPADLQYPSTRGILDR